MERMLLQFRAKNTPVRKEKHRGEKERKKKLKKY